MGSAEFAVRRIGTGSGFSRGAITAFLPPAREVLKNVTFSFAAVALYMSEPAELFKEWRDSLRLSLPRAEGLGWLGCGRQLDCVSFFHQGRPSCLWLNPSV